MRNKKSVSGIPIVSENTETDHSLRIEELIGEREFLCRQLAFESATGYYEKLKDIEDILSDLGIPRIYTSDTRKTGI